MCDECARLQAENARLRDRIKRAKMVIKKQKEQLEAVRGTAWKIILQAREVLEKPSGVPRGTWAMWRGRGEVAATIFQIVYVDWTGMVGDIFDG